MKISAAKVIRLARPLIVGLSFVLGHGVLFVVLVSVSNVFAGSNYWLANLSRALVLVPLFAGYPLDAATSRAFGGILISPHLLWFLIGLIAGLIVKQNRVLIYVFAGAVILLMGIGYFVMKLLSGIGP